VEEIIVTGTRASGISAADSPAPIQVVTTEDLVNTGRSDLAGALAQIVPSFVAQGFGQDMANQTLSAKLRGLSPNHVLVLIDGKRRHTTANLAILAGVYQGGAGADLNFIPVEAVDHIEVLTEGAAAQYGTDAIAGVINIILKKGSSGGSVGTSYGGYEDGGGRTSDTAANFGLAPSENSYINITGEVRNHGFSDRGAVDPRVIDPALVGTSPATCAAETSGSVNCNLWYATGYPHMNLIAGDSESHLKVASLNAGVDLGGGTQVYSFATYGEKQATSYENFRLPSKISYDPPGGGATQYLYPFGFNPQEALREEDYSITAGIKGAAGGWNWDLATGYGNDSSKLYTLNSGNTSLYSATGTSPVNFYDGQFTGTQWTTTLDFNRDFDVGGAGPLNVAVGAESRKETYTVGAGDGASHYLVGAQSFPGFSPTDAGSHDRKNYAGYVDLSAQPFSGLRVDAAARYEHFSDFGNTTIGKLTARYDVNSTFAVRGTASTGFRAPTLAEEYYSATNVSPSTATVQLPPNAAAAAVIGLGTGLQPEKSTSFSAGIVLTPAGGPTVTLDIYQIEIRNRIVGTGQLTGSSGGVIVSQAVLDAILANGNVLDSGVINTGVSIFTNGIDTRTRGADLTLAFLQDYGFARVNWTVGATLNDTSVTKVRKSPTELNGQSLFDKQTISDLETASPKYVLNLGADWSHSKATISLHEIIYGEAVEQTVDDYGDTSVIDPTVSGSAFYQTKIGVTPLTNLDVSFEVAKGLKLSAGANNLFNRYPPKYPKALLDVYNNHAVNDNTAVEQYPIFSPFGFNGAFIYAKLKYNF
jgi:iron complex outermembrane receptor protein